MAEDDVWNDLVGDSWVRWDDQLEGQIGPFGHAAMDALGPLDGRRVLDVGCGAGRTTCELAGRGAEAVGVDLSAPMLELARQRAAGQGVDVRFEQADVTTPDLDLGGPFDAVFSRFGVMFFEDAPAAFARLHERVRPGGKLAIATWQGPFENPWMIVPRFAIVPIAGPPDLPEPGAPGPFSLPSAEVLHELLDGAGFHDVAVQPVNRNEPHPAGDAASVAAMTLAIAPPLAEAVRAHPDQAEEMHALVVEALQPYVTDDGVVLASAGLVTTATA